MPHKFGAMICTAALVIAAGPAHADVKDGVDAWARGDYAAAVAQWQGPAAQGDPDAMFNMGQAYKLGRGVPRDQARAESYFAQAAQKGHVRAADNYGLLLFQSGRQADAMPWLTASADRGEPRAMYVLGIAAYNGDYAPKDLVRAYALMTRAAQAGLQQAISSLAAMNEAIPLEQRQQAVALAGDMDRKAAAARASEMGAADLGNPPPVQVAAATPPAPVPPVVAPPAPPAHALDRPHPAPPAPKPPRVAVPAQPAAAPGGTWRVQLGAFGQKSNADALWSKVRNRPEIAGHPRSDVGTGVARLTATGYSLESAQHACATLKAAGLTCIVVSH
jgi:hypothetical protein